MAQRYAPAAIKGLLMLPRRILPVALALIALSSALPTCLAQARYSFEVLVDKKAGGLGVSFSAYPRGNGINHDGVIVGYLGTQYATTTAAKWKRQKPKALAVPDGASSAKAFAINSSGIAVGSFRKKDSDMPIAWSPDNEATLLYCSYRKAGCWAYDINDAGTIAGRDGYRAVTWSKVGEQTNLKLAQGHTGAAAFGINAQGDIAGASFQEYRTRPRVATIWKAGGKPTLLEGIASGNCEAVSLNDSAEAVGDCWSEDSYELPVHWKDGHVFQLPLPELQSYGMAFDIDNAGIIVGASSGAERLALMWKDGQVYTLNSMVDSAVLEDWSLATAYAINDVGQITGLAADLHQEHVYYPYRLTPVDASERRSAMR